MKKILVGLVIILVIGVGYLYYSKASRDRIVGPLPDSGGNIIFTESEKDIPPQINAKLNEEFKISLGQVASFQEGFKVMFIGYEFGCQGSFGKDLRDLIIKRAEASQCPAAAHAVYAVIKDGNALVGQHETYINGYQIYTMSDDSLRQEYANIIVSLVDKSDVERMQLEEKNRQLELRAKKESAVSYCMEINNEEQKRSCVNFIARNTYLSEGFYPVNVNEKILEARGICKPIGYEKGFCLIVGKEKVATPEMCDEWENQGKTGGEWRGTEFYEDCDAVSKNYYKTQ